MEDPVSQKIGPIYKGKYLGHRSLYDYECKRMRPKVAMVGFADGSMMAPWKDESFEIWS